MFFLLYFVSLFCTLSLSLSLVCRFVHLQVAARGYLIEGFPEHQLLALASTALAATAATAAITASTVSSSPKSTSAPLSATHSVLGPLTARGLAGKA